MFKQRQMLFYWESELDNARDNAWRLEIAYEDMQATMFAITDVHRLKNSPMHIC